MFARSTSSARNVSAEEESAGFERWFSTVCGSASLCVNDSISTDAASGWLSALLATMTNVS